MHERFPSLAARSAFVVAFLAVPGCDQNMSETPLPEAAAGDVSRLAERLSEAPSLSVPAGATISGLIELDPKLAGLVSPTDVIYVIARDPGAEGPPLAVERLTGNAYPMRFVLDATTAMLAGVAGARPVQLVAKVDKDGDVGTSSAEDLVGFTPEPVAPGESDVRILVLATLGEIAAAVGEEIAEGEERGGPVRISGTITLPDALRARTSADDVLFVIARDPATPGPPVAVARLSGNRYPMAFSLGDRDRMLGGSWPERVEVEARLDADGDPLTRGPGDLAGRAPDPVSPGQAGVRIELGG
jgi:hypothetical protein